MARRWRQAPGEPATLVLGETPEIPFWRPKRQTGYHDSANHDFAETASTPDRKLVDCLIGNEWSCFPKLRVDVHSP